MKDLIDCFAKLLENIHPLLPQLEKRFNEENIYFTSLESIDRSLIAHVLKYHLIVEVYLNRFLKNHYPQLAWDDADLRFAQKIKLISSNSNDFPMQFIVPGIKELNRIRNQFGHRLDASLDLADVAEMKKCLLLAKPTTNYTDPAVVIQDFATTACTLLSIPQDLEDVMQKTFESILNSLSR